MHILNRVSVCRGALELYYYEYEYFSSTRIIGYDID